MCTAISYKTCDHYFGRTLDIELSYGECVCITPRNFPIRFTDGRELKNHYAIIGMAAVVDDYPLYFEAANELGLGMAGLNFPGNACYFSPDKNKENVAPFEFILRILAPCKSLGEAASALENINLCNINFSKNLPLSPLHWMIADSSGCLTVESTKEGLKIYENPVGVLTNNPPFDYHLTHLADFVNLNTKEPKPPFWTPAETYSRGMGAIGLPGDLSSASRFVRAAFTKENSVSKGDENESLSQFFHILGTVEQTRGVTELSDGVYEITAYTSCINTDKGIYYYKTYENSCISAVDMRKSNLDSAELSLFPLQKNLIINLQN